MKPTSPPLDQEPSNYNEIHRADCSPCPQGGIELEVQVTHCSMATVLNGAKLGLPNEQVPRAPQCAPQAPHVPTLPWCPVSPPRPRCTQLLLCPLCPLCPTCPGSHVHQGSPLWMEHWESPTLGPTHRNTPEASM